MPPASGDSLRARWKLSMSQCCHAVHAPAPLTLDGSATSAIDFEREIGCDTYRQDADNPVDKHVFESPVGEKK